MSVACQWARRDLALLSLLGGWAHSEWEKSAVSTSGYWGGQECSGRVGKITLGLGLASVRRKNLILKYDVRGRAHETRHAREITTSPLRLGPLC